MVEVGHTASSDVIQLNRCFRKIRLKTGPVFIIVTPDPQEGDYTSLLRQRDNDMDLLEAEKYKPIWKGSMHKSFLH